MSKTSSDWHFVALALKVRTVEEQDMLDLRLSSLSQGN